RFRRYFGKVLRRRRDAVVAALAFLKFALAEIGIVGRVHLGDDRSNADLTLELEIVAGRLSGQLDRNRQLGAGTLRGAGQGLAVDREIDDEAVLAIGAFGDGVADIEGSRGESLALPGLLQDHFGIATHQ